MTARRRGRPGGAGRLLPRLLLVLGCVAVGAFGAWAWMTLHRGPAAVPPGPGTEAGRQAEAPTPPPPPPATPLPAEATSTEALPKDFEPVEKQAKGGALAVVLDDVGFAGGALDRLARLSGPLTVAIIPDAPRAAEAAALARSKGWDVLVHLPMEPVAGAFEPGSIGPGDDDGTIAVKVEDALARVPGAIGVNNHQGSKATADRRVVRAVLSVLHARGLLFLDSRTTAASVGAAEAQAMGVPSLSRDVFLDAARAERPDAPLSPAVFAPEWERALRLARRNGRCVVIGHPHADTLDFLSSHLPDLPRRGILRVRLSELVD